jgi:hypothetical protein
MAAGFVGGSAPDGRFGTTTMGFAREVAELFLAGRKRSEVCFSLGVLCNP